VLALLLWLGAATAGGLQWGGAAGPPVRVSILQGNIEQTLKWRPEQLRATLDIYLRLTEAAADSRVIIWPETAVPAFAHQVEADLLGPLEAWARAGGRDLVLGIPVRDDDGRYYNTLLNLGVSGRDRYDKRHLVPFGEFMPLRPLLGPLAEMFAIPMSSFAAGEAERPVLRIAGSLAGASICYEDAFGAEVVEALPDAAFLLNASNDAWFGDSLAPHQHLEIARMRAAETDRFLLRATNTGVSAIIGPRGERLAVAPQFAQAVLSGTIEPRSGATLFARAGNAAVVVLAVLMLGAGAWVAQRRKTF
jgi:apolipoprotein N-acyltransferase